MTSEDVVKIGDEMIRALEPVYQDLDSIKKTLSEHTDKIDALIVDVKQLQDTKREVYNLSSFRDII